MKAVELSYSRSDKQVQKESFTSHLGFHEKLFEYYINKGFWDISFKKSIETGLIAQSMRELHNMLIAGSIFK